MSARRLGLCVGLGIVILVTAGLPDSLGGADEPGSADNRPEQAVLAAQQPSTHCEAVDASQCLGARRYAELESPVRKDPVLSWPLVQLAEADGVPWALGRHVREANLPKPLRDLATARLMRFDETGSVQVFIHADGSARSLVPALEAVEVKVQRVDEEHGILQSWVPTRRLRSVADAPGVTRVRLPDYGFPTAGSVMSEGDGLLNAAAARSTFGIDGSGVRVGVISDGVGGLSASQASGDLPAVDTSTCNVAGGDPGAAGAEGTAMLEIVHDVAPGASLLFGNFGFGTVLDFNAAVNCLAANADIVVDDIGWFGVGAYDGTSLVSANTAAALNGSGPIRGYYTSVGNSATSHYQGTFVDSGDTLEDGPNSWSFHQFDATGGSMGTENALGTAPLSYNRLALAPGGTVSIIVQWDDPWGASSNDYDLFYGLGPDVFLCSGDSQDGFGDPVEACTVENTSGVDQAYDIFIGNWLDMAAPKTLDMFLLCDGCLDLGNGNDLDFNTPGSSVSNQGDAGGSPAAVVSVGAVPHYSGNSIESFSSRGPTEDGRMKPDLVAPDGVSVTGAGGFPSPFYGTSAAAPHAAAVAALVLECDPTTGRVSLHNLLLNSAVDLGDAGPDNVYGNGRLDALAAVTSAGCASTTATPSPTVAPTVTPTATIMPTTTVTATTTGTPAATPTPCPPGACTPTATPMSTTTSTPTPPAGGVGNDRFADASIISGLPFVGTQNTAGATTEAGEPLNPDGCILAYPRRMGATVWYRFTASTSMTVTIDTFGSTFDTVLAVYTGDAVDALIPVACNDDSQSLLSEVSFPGVAGTTYHVQAGGFSGQAGDLSLNVSSEPAPAPTSTATAALPPGAPSEQTGDVSCDGSVNSIDAALMLQYSAGLTSSLACHEVADVNGDLAINAVDAALVLQLTAGLIPLGLWP